MTDDVDRLREDLAATRRREAELRELLAQAHAQLAERDDELVRDLAIRAKLAYEQVEVMRSTKLWRAGTAYWRARDRVRGLLGGAARR